MRIKRSDDYRRNAIVIIVCRSTDRHGSITRLDRGVERVIAHYQLDAPQRGSFQMYVNICACVHHVTIFYIFYLIFFFFSYFSNRHATHDTVNYISIIMISSTITELHLDIRSYVLRGIHTYLLHTLTLTSVSRVIS